jgi:serine/threonine-protein kinase
MSIRCAHCGLDAPDGSTFCVNCRASLSSDADETRSPTLGAPSASAAATVSAGQFSPPFAGSAGVVPMQPGYVFAARYRIDRLLGSGGMGAVYQAWDQELDVAVALKVIRPDIIANTGAAHDFEQRFKQELLMARRVTHRNVTRIHDLGESGGVKYITMQFVEGTDLAAILKQGPLPFERTVAFARQLASGIAAAHEVGVVHRDLKPHNVLIDAADNVYISDFGLAKSLETSLAGLTRTGELVGTPKYFSPEQVEGKPVDHRSDLYALGLILFEMATGGSPFSGSSAIELMFQRVQAAPRHPQLLNPDLPDYFCRIIMRCLAYEPEARYASARDISADLDAERAEIPKSSIRSRSITLTLPVTSRAKLAVVAAVIVGVAAAVPLTRRYVLPAAMDQPVASAAAPVQRYVAVLPFRVIGEEAGLAHIAAGVEEALSTKLFQLPTLNVASAAAVERAAGKESLAAIARELGANLLISGTVQGTADGMRVTVALDDTNAGSRVWAQDFSGVSGDLLTIEDQIYNRLLSALNLVPTSEELARALSHPTENIEAYQLYLRGRNAMRGQQDLKNVTAAIGFYEEALKKDAGFARAYAGISDSALRLYRTTKESSWAEKALSSAQQAQRLDEKLVEVHLALGSIYQATGKTTEAIAELTIASELAPRSDEVFRRLARAYLASGRGGEAIQAYEKAVAVNPYYWVSYSALGVAHMTLGSPARAVETFRKVVELEPRNVSGHNDLGAAYLQMGRYDDSAAAFKRAIELQPTAQTYTNLGIAYAYGGKHADAIPMFERAVELSPNAEQFIGNLGDGYRWDGQATKAATAYSKAIALALKELAVNPRNAQVRGNLALYYAKKGDRTQAQRFMSDARAIDRTNINLIYAEAIVEVLAGRKDKALLSLEEALKAGYPFSAAQSDPDVHPLLADVGFKQLATKFGSN